MVEAPHAPPALPAMVRAWRPRRVTLATLLTLPAPVALRSWSSALPPAAARPPIPTRRPPPWADSPQPRLEVLAVPLRANRHRVPTLLVAAFQMR